MNETLITIEDLCVSYNGLPVLSDINLTIMNSEIMTIVGPNGGGKSTLLKALLGLVTPSSGKVILSEKMKSLPGSSRFGYLPQNYSRSAPFPLSVYEVVAMSRLPGKRFIEKLSRADREAVDEAIELTGITALAGKNYSELSGGQKQRALISRAIATNPALFLLDEPSTGLDAVAQEGFYEILKNLKNARGLGIVMVSHDIGSVAGISDRVACLNGKLHFHGSPEGCFKDSSMEKIFGKNIFVLKHDSDCATCRRNHAVSHK
jgi:zinc transport system ATP-binding protein